MLMTQASVGQRDYRTNVRRQRETRTPAGHGEALSLVELWRWRAAENDF
jgi:hypothetical protein